MQKFNTEYDKIWQILLSNIWSEKICIITFLKNPSNYRNIFPNQLQNSTFLTKNCFFFSKEQKKIISKSHSSKFKLYSEKRFFNFEFDDQTDISSCIESMKQEQDTSNQQLYELISDNFTDSSKILPFDLLIAQNHLFLLKNEEIPNSEEFCILNE